MKNWGCLTVIEVKKVQKRFGRTTALSRVSLEIPDGAVYGLIGANGAGKSTLMRMLSGVLKPDHGSVLLDGVPVYENPAQKRRCFSVSDEQYFFSDSTPRSLMRYYAVLYPKFNAARCRGLLAELGLGERSRLRAMSKGMRRQVWMALAVSARTDCLLCDEAFDGLDPVSRQTIKKAMIEEIDERGLTVVLTSHNLFELENLADHVGLLNQGALLFSSRVDEVRGQLRKIQYVSEQPSEPQTLFAGCTVLSEEKRGRLCTAVVRGSREQTDACLHRVPMVYCEDIPLSLEEIFVTEMEAKGYETTQIGV